MKSVRRLWRHPVKSMGGEEVQELEVTPGGVVGDRVYAFREADTGDLVSAKRHGALLRCQARLLDHPTPDAPAPPIEVTFPDGSLVRDDESGLTRRVSALLGVEVHLTTDEPGTMVDFAPLHVLSLGTLRRLADAYPDGDWDPVRFRPNILIGDDGTDAPWLSCDVHIGTDVVVHVAMPTPRCVMTTRAQGNLPRDPKILRTVTGVGRQEVGRLGKFPCTGWYAEVVNVGTVRCDDPVTIDHVAPRQGVLASALEALAARSGN